MTYTFEKPVFMKFYFENDKTKNFTGVKEVTTVGNWQILQLEDGTWVNINSNKVMFIEARDTDIV